jgi:hypothetical protein
MHIADYGTILLLSDFEETLQISLNQPKICGLFLRRGLGKPVLASIFTPLADVLRFVPNHIPLG